MSETQTSAARPGLSRVLGLWSLVIYGIVLVQPTAPMSPFGVVSAKAEGHVVTAILIGMVAMLFTAISYGRMAAVYPSAGSAYAYVGHTIHPAAGYVTGWSMLFDYVMNPIICVIWCSKAAANFVPLPFAVWATFFALLFTVLNLQGIKTSARTNAAIAVGLVLVIVLFLAAAFRYLAGVTLDATALTRPFYDPATFSWDKVSTGTSLAVLTYIGFDGISTLSEEAKNPRRNILLATVIVCLFTGIVGSLLVYLAQLIWPDWSSYPDVDTAFVHVAGRAGGPVLFGVLNMALLVANVGSGMGAHLGASRLLYGMGRDNAIPRGFFGALNPRTHVPSNNVILVGAIALAGAFTVSYGLGAELLNFGAFIAFMGVNLSALLHYWWRAERKALVNLVPPLLGLVICAYLWWSLSTAARLAGFAWLATGVAYGAWKTQGFKKAIEFREADDAPVQTQQTRGDGGGSTPMPWFVVGATKLVVMSVVTFGLYEIYWFYQQWQRVRTATGEKIQPALRAIFGVIFCHSLFKRIVESARAAGLEPLTATRNLSGAFILLTICWRLPDPFWLITFLSVLPLVAVQRLATAVALHAAPGADPNARLTPANWVGVVLGGVLLVLAVVGTSLPDR